MRKALIAVPAAAALLLAGCSSSAKQAQTLPVAAGSTTTGAAASSTPAASVASELLTISDMPAGWTTSKPSSSSGGPASCSALNNGQWKALPERAEADFQQSEIGPFVVEKLDAGSSAQVSAAWTAFGSATSACQSFTSTDSTGTTKFTLSQLSFPSYGDATYAFGITADDSGVSASGDIVVVRKGDTLVQIIAIGVPDVPVSVVEQATKTAVGKVK